jgi:hypothetical protein
MSPLCTWPSADGEFKEETAIRTAVEHQYIAGLQTRDFGLIEEICLPDTRLMGARDNGELRITTLEQWSRKFDPKAPPFQQLDFVISRIDRVGTAAQVRIDFTVDSAQHVTDFLNMVKVDGKWRIVSIIDY